jgi:hypothetical protein
MVLVAVAVAIVGVLVLRGNSAEAERAIFNVGIADINCACLYAWASPGLTDVIRNIPPMLP